MKKLVYILVAVFTMISVNANATTYNLHFCYPGCDENEVNEIIWVDTRTEYKNGTVFNESKEVIDWNLPTCKGYKFVGFYTKVDNSLRAKVIYPFEDGYVIKTASSEDVTLEVYGKWEKDTKNYEWNSDGSGFYYVDLEEWHRYYLPWNHMVMNMIMDKLTDTQLYIHYNYPGAIEAGDETVHETVWIDKDVFSDNQLYTDKTKTKVFTPSKPTCKGYYFVGFGITKDAKESETIVHTKVYATRNTTMYEKIGEWAKASTYSSHIYGIWERDTKNYNWGIKSIHDDYGNTIDKIEGFYVLGENSYGYKNFVPWNHMYINNTSTGINDVEVSTTPSKEGIYTLNGVKVENITKSGIYIINGKKVVK